MTEKKTERIDKILSNLGYCSRSQAAAFLRKHSVQESKTHIKDPSCKAAASNLTINGEKIDHPDGIFILLNKPAGFVCSHDPSEGTLIYDLLPERWMRRNPVPSSAGRLDKDTTGILLITDDTKLIHTLSSPKSNIEKLYLVTVDKPISKETAELLTAGTLILQGEKAPCRPAKLTLLDDNRCEITLTEGKYHQVKRMFAACGLQVLKLHRRKFGEYCVDGIEEGEYREISFCS
ncbi:MAG: rRNA pseudouridine synthase [Chitinispirillales bacterium]|jgi:16S rRNA pseudouridine516 synthase|nr:rRNA pseudouridine synthase [Chitinispirillales bacterium]